MSKKSNTKFSFPQELMKMLLASIAFVMALALNDAVKETFELLDLKKYKILGLWLYAIVVIVIGLLFTYAYTKVITKKKSAKK